MLLTLLSMSAFTLVGAISPGPVNIIATSVGAQHGYKSALPHVLGASFGFAAIVMALGSGLHSLFQQAGWSIALSLCGAIYLLHMAYRIATAGPFHTGTKWAKPPGFIDGMLCQLLNPKAWLFSLSGIGIFANGNEGGSAYLVLSGALVFLVCWFGIGSWAAAGTVISKWLKQPQQQCWFNRCLALLLCVTVGFMCSMTV